MSSIFDEINASVEARKRQKREAYIELPDEVWCDDGEPEWIVVASEGDGGTRSTFLDKGGQLLNTRRAIARPTEVLALLAMRGYLPFDDQWWLIVMPEITRPEKYCLRCQLRLPITSFSPDQRASDGRHSYCKTCRAEAKRLRWKRGA
jgi:hypothetical protein